MNPGELRYKIEVMSLNSTVTDTDYLYSWKITANTWAKAEMINVKNIFSNFGIGAKSVKFTMRKRELTLHNAFQWKGAHCFLTDIVEIDRMYYEVTAALIEPKICLVERMGEPTLNELNRPTYNNRNTLTFPGYLVEKYLGHEQDKPMATTETRYILVTSKAIELATGELVTIENATYAVEIPHTLDEYKNEYEIAVRSDA